MRNYLLALTRNPVSLIGAALTTASAVLILTLVGLDLLGFHGGPYGGLISAVLLPLIFVVGLLLIPIGAWLERRRARRSGALGEAPPAFPVIDLNRDKVRRAALLILALTVVNLAILAIASFKAVEAVESTKFCGSTCHTVMAPEYTAYKRSPHAHVACVACHVGPGAESFVKAKLSGVRQLVHVVQGSYPRPVPTPVEDLRATDETCGHCHATGQYVGDRLKVITKFTDDEKNTETKTVLMMKIGGSRGGRSAGIHWHADPKNVVRYRSDARREKIEEVRLAQSGEPEVEGWRTMDCSDCHNRSGHGFRSAAQEVDGALVDGRLDKGLPFLKREALKALSDTYASEADARERIPARIRAFYGESYADRAAALSPAIAKAGEALAEIYASNVFPDMKVAWDTYPDHLGHDRFPGCFRCHDGEKSVAADRTITADCATCHDLLAQDEESPAILTQLQP